MSKDTSDTPGNSPTDKVLYLDIDGVLNFYKDFDFNKHSKRLGVGDTKKASFDTVNLAGELDSFTFHYSGELISLLRDLSKDTGTEVIFLTTWRKDALDVVAPALGIDFIDSYLDFELDSPASYKDPRDFYRHIAEIKRDTLYKDLRDRVSRNSGRPLKVAWVDDEVFGYVDTGDLRANLSELLGTTFLDKYFKAISPGLGGMSRADFDSLSDFLKDSTDL